MKTGKNIVQLILFFGLLTLLTGCTSSIQEERVQSISTPTMVQPVEQAANYLFSLTKQEANELEMEFEISDEYDWIVHSDNISPADRANGINNFYEMELLYAVRCQDETQWENERVFATVFQVDEQWDHGTFIWGGIGGGGYTPCYWKTN